MFTDFHEKELTLERSGSNMAKGLKNPVISGEIPRVKIEFAFRSGVVIACDPGVK